MWGGVSVGWIEHEVVSVGWSECGMERVWDGASVGWSECGME